MPGRDFWRLAWDSVAAHPLRSALTMLGIVIGIASVILLTSLGEGTRRAIAADFSQFGTNVMAIHRGKTTTTGIPGAVGGTTRKLTIEDSETLRRVPGVEQVVPVAFGSARVETGERGRSVVVYGVTADVPAVWRFEVRQGRFLPAGDPRRSAPLAVLGPRLKRELFGESNALGERVRIGGRRFLVIGVMASKGQLLGFDMDDTAYIPVASAQSLFNTEELLEIDLSFSREMAPARVKAGVREALMRRHGGEEDFTVTTQTEMLDVLNRVMSVVTLAVGGIGADLAPRRRDRDPDDDVDLGRRADLGDRAHQGGRRDTCSDRAPLPPRGGAPVAGRRRPRRRRRNGNRRRGPVGGSRRVASHRSAFRGRRARRQPGGRPGRRSPPRAPRCTPRPARRAPGGMMSIFDGGR